MRWTCEKCGKKLEISEEQLSETQGVIVCPQCLGTDTIPGYKRTKKKVENKPTTRADNPQKQVQPKPVETNLTSETNKQKATPPPYHKKTRFVEKKVTTPKRAQPVSQLVRKPKAPGNKKKKKGKKGTPTSGWGCLWKSALITIAILTLYILMGYLLQGI